MIKRMNLTFSEKNHEIMKEKKNELAKKIGKNRMGWEDYILHVTGVKICKKQ